MSAEAPGICYEGIHCTLTIEKSPPHVIVLRISGCDIGEFGEAPMRALNESVSEANPVDLFIDARDVSGASIEVSGEWAAWLGAHRAGLRSVTMLTGSRFVQITAEFVRRFASLEGIMRIGNDSAVFDFELAEATQAR
ncbi:MAG TPA: hypothetical protein VG297_24455 [Bryobacteraceae bacterium]|jgi:hypothetical protein|nr:hypothetical protein [Bryobacteraceae bacterium]